MIKGAVSELAPGELSSLIPTQSGGVVAALEKREPAETKESDPTKNFFNLRFLNSKREVAFYEWLRERWSEAGVKAKPEAMPDEAG